MKTGVGAQAYPVSGYLRCKSRVMRALSKKMMKVRGMCIGDWHIGSISVPGDMSALDALTGGLWGSGYPVVQV